MSPLPRGPLQAPPEVARDPSSGRGLAADEIGRGHIAARVGNWNMEYVSATVDVPNTGSDAGGTMTVSNSAFRKGDLVQRIGKNGTAGRGFIFDVETSEVTTAGEITLGYFNPSGSASDPGSTTHSFLVIHRNLIQ